MRVWLVSKRLAAFVAGAVILSAAAGFFAGSKILVAGESVPGSAGDPLVARSYVDEKVSAYISELEKKVSQLSARALELEKQLAELQKKVGLTPIAPGSAVPVSGETGTAGGSSSGSGSQASGESASGSAGLDAEASRLLLYIKEENSYVNLRSGPGTDYEKLGTVERGKPGSEPMVVLDRQGDWYQVSLPDGRKGWVAGWLVVER